MRVARVVAQFALLGLGAALAVGCAKGGEGASSTTFTTSVGSGSMDESGSEGGTDDPTDGGETDGEGEGICLLHNCESDLECGGCTEGRTMCLLEEKRCIACEPGGEGCPEGEECSEFGYCVPAGQTCPTDGEGEPTVNCNADADCGACDPRHLVCDTATHACVGCTAANEEHCQSTQHCDAGACVDDCPESCTEDADCSQCGGAMNDAHACVAHRCAECGDDVPCPQGQVCNAHGVCADMCGLPGMTAGTCDDDSNCAGCPGDATNCNTPINGGHGTCGPQASGCSDLGEGVVVLPEPFDEVTNLCSDDGDCAGIGVEYNVGELLRDITGLDEIGDAIIEYPMSKCASVSVGVGEGNVSCGVCVPCEVDGDCQDIDIDQVAGDAFGPLGAIAAALLLDQLFGDDEHNIYMFCQPVGAGYGVCAPCPTLVNDCSGSGGGGGGDGSCDHDVCEAGGPLEPSCGACAADVCAVDGYCCEVDWDDTCIAEVEDYCAGGCSGGGDGGSCGHDECVAGSALDASCSTCTSAVCSADPYCCQTEWDATCVSEVATECGDDCSGGGGGCLHDECSQGGPLVSTCSSCVADVCAADDYCCTTDWDSTCVDEADQICGGICGGGGGGCAHDECMTGAPLDESCSFCVADVCAADDYCCTTSWDATCVDIADQVCGGICGGGGGGFGCAHDECSQGGALDYGCSDCATAVCDSDPVCCNEVWDDVCVDEAAQICGC